MENDVIYSLRVRAQVRKCLPPLPNALSIMQQAVYTVAPAQTRQSGNAVTNHRGLHSTFDTRHTQQAMMIGHRVAVLPRPVCGSHRNFQGYDLHRDSAKFEYD